MPLAPEAIPHRTHGGEIWVISLVALRDVSGQIAASIKQIVIDVTDFLTPVIDVICIGMIVIGMLLMALRQEFYGIRLCLGGGIGLIIIHLVIPLLIGFL
jgi:hypothetical protein